MEVPGRWVHRLAVLMVCLVWPLIWLGGLVTTYDAGMAVPDWPGTYGYNLFLYPVETWLFGPFDLLIEHGHRQLAAVVGLVAIVTLVVAWMVEPRRWVVWLSGAVLVAVSAQGILGGARVVTDQRTLAMIHGCGGALVFAMATGLAVVSSRWWWMRGPSGSGLDDWDGVVRRRAVWGAGILAILTYVQLVVGAQLRHVQVDTSPVAFRHLVEAHVGTALVIWLVSGVVAVQLWRCGDLALSRPARLLIGLVAIQIALGVATWVVTYGVLVSTEHWPWAAQYVIRAKGYIESGIVTAHVAVGSLLVACTVMLWLRALRAAEYSREVLVDSKPSKAGQVAG